MPLHQDYHDMIKADHCDVKNFSGAPWGGPCTAAAFLEKFVEKDVEFAHVDIAGVAGMLPNAIASGYGV